MNQTFISIFTLLIYLRICSAAVSMTGPPGGAVSINEDVTDTNWDVFTVITSTPTGNVLYQIQITPLDGKLRSHYNNGTVYHYGEPNFDHETVPRYTVEVTAIDTDSADTITYNINIADINELPEVTNLPATVNLEETPYTGGGYNGGDDKIFELNGYDEEEGKADVVNGLAKLDYEIVSVVPASGAPKFVLSTSPSSYKVGVVTDPLFNYEDINQYNISIRAKDKNSPPATGPAKILTIDIVDVNEAPFFNDSVGLAGTVNYEEEMPVGSEVNIVVPVTGEIRAYDYDAGDVLTYELDGQDQQFFEVRNIGGVARIFISQKPDYEQRIPANTITMNVRARDKAGLITVPPFVLTMKIININDNLPVCSPTKYSGTVNEDSKAGDTILTITCTDADGPLDRYEIEDFTKPDIYFEANPDNGAFLVKTPPDLEQDTVLTFPVWAVQGIPYPQTSTSVTVTVTIDAANDNRPKFNKEFYNFDIRYDAALASSVGKITAVDNDVTESILTYDWVSAIYQFKLDPLDGRVRVQAAMEENQKWTLFAVAKDNDNPPDFSDHVPIRIDAFNPDEVLVDFSVSKPVSYFTDLRIEEFLDAVTAACAPCLARFSSMESTPGEESTKTTLTIYALTDSTTETFANIETTKLYVKIDTMLNIFSSDVAVGTPSAATTTTGFHSYPVTEVRAHRSVTLTAGEWLTQTGGGIAVLCLLCLLAVAIVAAAIYGIIKSGICKREPVSHNIKRPQELGDVDTFDYRYKNNDNNLNSSYKRFSNVNGRGY